MKDKKIVVSHDDIQSALRAFQARGGLIMSLPDEVALGRTLVGSKWSMYETGEDIVSAESEARPLN